MNYLYRFIDCYDNIIYVGKTTQGINQRMYQHFGKNGHLPKECINSVARIEVKPIHPEVNLEYIEKQLVQYLQPTYNTIWKGEKSTYIPQQHLEDWHIFKDIKPVIEPQPVTDLAVLSPTIPHKWGWVDNVFSVLIFILFLFLGYGLYNMIQYLILNV